MTNRPVRWDNPYPNTHSYQKFNSRASKDYVWCWWQDYDYQGRPFCPIRGAFENEAEARLKMSELGVTAEVHYEHLHTSNKQEARGQLRDIIASSTTNLALAMRRFAWK